MAASEKVTDIVKASSAPPEEFKGAARSLRSNNSLDCKLAVSWSPIPQNVSHRLALGPPLTNGSSGPFHNYQRPSIDPAVAYTLLMQEEQRKARDRAQRQAVAKQYYENLQCAAITIQCAFRKWRALGTLSSLKATRSSSRQASAAIAQQPTAVSAPAAIAAATAAGTAAVPCGSRAGGSKEKWLVKAKALMSQLAFWQSPRRRSHTRPALCEPTPHAAGASSSVAGPTSAVAAGSAGSAVPLAGMCIERRKAQAYSIAAPPSPLTRWPTAPAPVTAALHEMAAAALSSGVPVPAPAPPSSEPSNVNAAPGCTSTSSHITFYSGPTRPLYIFSSGSSVGLGASGRLPLSADNNTASWLPAAASSTGSAASCANPSSSYLRSPATTASVLGARDAMALLDNGACLGLEQKKCRTTVQPAAACLGRNMQWEEVEYAKYHRNSQQTLAEAHALKQQLGRRLLTLSPPPPSPHVTDTRCCSEIWEQVDKEVEAV